MYILIVLQEYPLLGYDIIFVQDVHKGGAYRWLKNYLYIWGTIWNVFPAFLYLLDSVIVILKPKWMQNLGRIDRKSTRLNSSHVSISYAVFCLKKKTKNTDIFGYCYF